MKILHTIAFIIFIYNTVSSKSKSLLDKLKRDIKNQKCNLDILNYFIYEAPGSDASFVAYTVNDKMKMICPSLKSSCCKIDELKQLQDRFNKGAKAFDIVKDNLNHLLEYVTDHDYLFNHMKALKKFRMVNSHFECAKDYDLDKLIDDCKKIGLLQEMIVPNIVKALDEFINVYSGFICQICDSEAGQNFFIQNKVPTVNYNKDNIIIILTAYNKLLKSLEVMRPFISLGDAVKCLYDSQKVLEEYNLHNFLDNENETNQRCIEDINTSISSFTKTHECIQHFEYIGEFNIIRQNQMLNSLFQQPLSNLEAAESIRLTIGDKDNIEWKRFKKYGEQQLDVEMLPKLNTKLKNSYIQIEIVDKGGIQLKGSEINFLKFLYALHTL